MTDSDPFRIYLTELRKNLATGAAGEHTHRAALEALIEALGDGLDAINEPARVECGAPDFIVTRGQTPVGYVEAKDVGADLEAEERSEQLNRYRESLTNLILTDYLEFRWYVEGEHRDSAHLATLTRDGKVRSTKAGVQSVADLLERFFAQETPTVGTARELAERMASLARMIRELIEEAYHREGRDGRFHGQLAAFRETLIPGLKPSLFADMYAQTIAYGLFAACVSEPTAREFTRETAAWKLPKTNPFLRRLFNEIAGPDLDRRIAWLVDNLAHLLARADMSEVLRDFGKATKQEDPVVHFYETFLGAYDPRMKQRRGVYYTPEPVVSYIVRSIDHILKTTFERPLGLAEEKVYILDPACGTGTFLYFVIQQIYDTVCKKVGRGAWSSYVRDNLLPRIFGFELLMAPYTVAHWKLGMQLGQLGYDFSGDQRLGIYLTNALAEAIEKPDEAQLPFSGFITEEAEAAGEVKKEKPIMVVLGNPPYSVSSANKGPYIEKLMERYKEAVRDERNIQPLSDDYIKFIRFAHDRIERTGYGIVGMITNHSYLSGLIHRGMREELMKTFDQIYVLNLHGSLIMRVKATDGGLDENVFDIRPGVAIALLVKRGESNGFAEVKYADVFGLRDDKYDYLKENDVNTTDSQALRPAPPHFFFVPKDLDLLSEYEEEWSVTKIFTDFSTGVGTGRDSAFVKFEPQTIQKLVDDLVDPRKPDSFITAEYGVRDTSGWNFFRRRRALMENKTPVGSIVEYQYRPFDIRFTFYHPIIRRDQRSMMKHMAHANVALLLCQQQATVGFQHVFCTRHIVDESVISTRSRERGYAFPLYLYTTPEDTEGTLFAAKEVTPESNLSPKLVAALGDKLVLDFVRDGKGDLQNTFGPDDVFNYMYAVFHSPTYRDRYAEFLKIDFPRLPLTSDLKLFRGLAEKGEALVALHLMESRKLNDLITTFPISDSSVVERVRYAEPQKDTPGRVYINKTQYFEGVEPEVWQFHIGGYRVLHKWLKDRKGRTLSFHDLLHYQKIVVALKETMRLMEEIDDLIPSWPIE